MSNYGLAVPPTMSSHYKLYYLNIRARAEPIRLLLHYTGQEYSAIDFDIEEWGNYEEGMAT